MVPAERGCPRWRGGRHQLPPSFPRSPGIIPVALSKEFSDLRTALEWAYAVSTNVREIDSDVLVPVRLVGSVPTAMLTEKVKLSPIIAWVN
jgi:hypothetical protein